MKNHTRKKVLVTDVLGQLILLIISLIFIRLFVLFLFIGGAWQLLSFLVHKDQRGESLFSINKLYWKLARIVLFLMIIAAFSMGFYVQLEVNVFGILFFVAGAVSFFGGIGLYLYYLFICFKDLTIITENETVLR